MRTARTAVSLLLSLCLPLAACGDDDDPNNPIDAGPGDDDDGGSIDAAPPDAAFCPAPAPGAIGGVCSMASDCGADPSLLCLNDDPLFPAKWPAQGYCLFLGSDVPIGDPIDCPTCPEGSVCRRYTDRLFNGGRTFATCLPVCCENGACTEGMACSQGLFGEALGGTACVPANPEAADGDTCSDFGDCAPNSGCLLDPFAFPNGQCARLNCTSVFEDGNNCAANGDGRCVAVDEDVPARCVDTCQNDSDCRMADGYVCFDGTAQGLGRFCRHPQVGDSCGDDDDCSGPPWNCRTAPDFPGGYCTVEACVVGQNSTCPTGGICFDPGAGAPFCIDRCNPDNAQTCRVSYDCTLVFDDTSPANLDQFGCLPE